MTAALEDAWRLRLERAAPDLVAFAATLARDRVAADDLAQDALLEALRSRASFKDGEDLGRWLRGVARMVLKRRQRDRRRDVLPLSEEAALRLDAAWENARRASDEPPRLDALRRCLETLDPAERRWLGARYGADRPLQSLADESGRTLDAVKMLFLRLRKRLFDCVRRRLGEIGR
jgi:RNA polymerase sigma-70 factor, ECF subfamily